MSYAYSENDNIKCAAISFAIKSTCGTEYIDGHIATNPDKLIEAAKKIEAYLKGDLNAHKT